MAKIPTFPTLYDNCNQIHLNYLLKQGLIKQHKWISTGLTWKCRGEKTGSISISTKWFDETPEIELSYTYKGNSIKNIIRTVFRPSNLGKGKILFFVCPKTGKRCRKLYSVEGHFYHRAAFRGCMYEKQTESKKYRYYDKAFGDEFRYEKWYNELHSPYFKKSYAGKPTKRYLKLSRKMEAADSISRQDIERAFFR